jgi:transcriptional regulator with AAA-type ATPase domain
MVTLTAGERDLAAGIAGLSGCNPFLPERLEWERRILGTAFVAAGEVWSAPAAGPGSTANEEHIQACAEALLGGVLARCSRGARLGAADARLLADVANYVLYYRHEPDFYALIRASEAGDPALAAPFFRAFAAAAVTFADACRNAGPAGGAEPAHLFACSFQVRRAFHCIHRHILGESMVTARLRAAVWQSIFTRDLGRYRRSLFDRLGDVSVLVTGASGTGKELVSRAIAYARYIPFDGSRCEFAVPWRESFHPLNLAALSPTLVESELFGHRKGAFTGALEDHPGWFESCGPQGTVFLDEIAEVPTDIQVKLLRVLEARTFSRLGDTAVRRFEGKLIAATNRDLGAAMAAGQFRADLYYRLCADCIRTPSLRERIESAPVELETLVRYSAERTAGPAEGKRLAAEVLAWIRRHLGAAYPWPGNVRELEQCVRSVMLRGEYQPAGAGQPQRFWEQAQAGELTADELLDGYCRQAYRVHGSYEEAGRRLGLDRRTVRARSARAGVDTPDAALRQK